MEALPEISPDETVPNSLDEAEAIINKHWALWRIKKDGTSLYAQEKAQKAMANIDMALEWALDTGHFRRMEYPADGGEIEKVEKRDFIETVRADIASLAICAGWSEDEFYI